MKNNSGIKMNQKYLILLVSIFLIGVHSSPVSEQQQPSDKKLPEGKPPTISSAPSDRINTELVPTSVPSANHSAPAAHIISDGISQNRVHENANITKNISKNITENITQNVTENITQNNTMNQHVNSSFSKSTSETSGNTSLATHDKTVPLPTEKNANQKASASDGALDDHSSSATANSTVPTAPTTAIAEKTASVKPTYTTVLDSVNTNSVVAEHNTPPAEGNHFDGASFVGGIVLTVGLTAIGFIAFKYYKSGRIDMNYRTL